MTADLVERFLAGESIVDLTRVYTITIPPQEVEMLLRQALVARWIDHERQPWR